MAPAAAATAIRSTRDPALVLEDVLDEKVSIEAARRDYGVAIDPDRRWSCDSDGGTARGCVARTSGSSSACMLDLRIRGGTVIDGTGAAARARPISA